MIENILGKLYQDGEYIVTQGEEGNTMFVVLSGKLQVFGEQDGHEIPFAVLERGDFFGEMALFEKGAQRSSTVRALGDAQVMTLDKRTLLRRINEDPLFALQIIETLCQRLRKISNEYTALSTATPMFIEQAAP